VVESRVLFAAKEAIYKAQYLSEEMFLEFHDIEIDLDLNRGMTSRGRIVEIAVTTFPRIFALAFIRIGARRR
jgi:4'-phosphopantetheinyl transferase EntD